MIDRPLPQGPCRVRKLRQALPRQPGSVKLSDTPASSASAPAVVPCPVVKLPAELVTRLAQTYTDRRVCVTGGAGFIGGHLVDALHSMRADVTILDDLSNSNPDHLADLMELEPTRVRFIHGSILDDSALDAALSKASVVFHLAAMGSVPASVADPRRAWGVNATGTVRVLEAARRAGAARVVSASSSSVYGDGTGDSGTSASPGQISAKVETQPPAPLSPYAASKLAGEAAVRAWARSYGQQACSLRFFNVFGPRQPVRSTYAAVIPAFTAALLAGEAPVIFGDGSQSRDFTPVACAVVACLQAGAVQRDLGGQPINVGTGTRTSVAELAAMIAEMVGTAPSGTGGGRGVQPTYQPAREGDVRHSLADISLARGLLGYSPVTTLEAALRETVAFYRQTRAPA